MHSTYDLATGRVHFLSLTREVVGDLYRQLPRVVAVSLCWCVLSSTAVLAAPATTAALVAARSILDGDDFGVRDAAAAFRRFFWRSQAAFVPAFVLFDVAWWLWLHATPGGIAATMAAFVTLDVLLLYCFLLLYYGPLLVERDGSARETARASALLALTRVRASVGLFLFVASTAALLAFSVVGFVLLAPGALVTSLSLATRYLAGDAD
ncbi:hypothetical protein [Halegenticoccus tardaugens]|uniref:hypothetical protein n=1 Tax=Halegenticoccus tardaugens TaxID=2071624 RepID=UPI00100A74D7|nr:hypothetical protein [Halegenticoccus tardaugens]